MDNPRCYKCGKSLLPDEITTEHIPPKCLVTAPNYSKLITVPGCKECNLGRSKDDEYFRNWIVTGAAGLNTEARNIYQKKVKKSWDRRPAIKYGMRETLIRSDIVTPAGIYLGRVTYANIEEHRALPVLESIAKGILWHHFSYMESKFPFALTPFILHNPPADNDWVKFFYNITVPVTLVPAVFEYRFSQLSLDDGDLFHVFLVFYEQQVFYLQYLVDKAAPPNA